jgi:hypothetical protein
MPTCLTHALELIQARLWIRYSLSRRPQNHYTEYDKRYPDKRTRADLFTKENRAKRDRQHRFKPKHDNIARAQLLAFHGPRLDQCAGAKQDRKAERRQQLGQALRIFHEGATDDVKQSGK